MLAERVRRGGPVRFDEAMEVALYAPGAGFYETGGRSGGGGGHFLTSPEVGSLFGAVLAGALDTWWAELGRPDPFVVIECGAGRGTLAASILTAAPECASASALRYVLVERSAPLRRAQAASLALEPAAEVLGALAPGAGDESPVPMPGGGPLATSLPELPAGAFAGVILANELIDNLPFRLLQRTGDISSRPGTTKCHQFPEGRRMADAGGWNEVFVDEALAEVLVPVAGSTSVRADDLAPSARPGARIPLQDRARAWLRAALGALSAGRVVVIDYADTTPAMAVRPWNEWVRTYRGHGRGRPPLSDLGHQDITCEVAVDQLATVRPPSSDRSQAEFLAFHGIEDLVAEARRSWTERAKVGDLEFLRARSRISEATALTDPTGLGGFRVLEWELGNRPDR